MKLRSNIAINNVLQVHVTTTMIFYDISSQKLRTSQALNQEYGCSSHSIRYEIDTGIHLPRLLSLLDMERTGNHAELLTKPKGNPPIFFFLFFSKAKTLFHVKFSFLLQTCGTKTKCHYTASNYMIPVWMLPCPHWYPFA